ncbi:D-lactate dehydrogenase [Pseudochelatococcus contaminans]|uniref:Quinone-dependent D-lactate dehydrogenase n=1 Tax=Pseudochelatococcus contaminans TaxID=1538103 RepID=A0A7W6EGS4_9HYPH|nr:D-lactate dehydrogenase [Pseudochelatococcus contaminans]MBB3809600.1 D-lactate dehydrogenase [Pseudochelatococcus contaminans]
MNTPSPTNDNLVGAFRKIVGDAHVLTDAKQTRRFRKGYRFGDGEVLAVVQPGTLVEQWRVVQAAVAAGKIVLMQAANTGLTGGSTPDGNAYDREIVLISTRRLNGIQVIDDGRQVICLPGATLDNLEKTLKPLGREPHSVIGSSCIGASVLGGVCNNSGGALVRRGPAFTQLALYGQVGEDGVLRLVNHLGVQLGNDPEDILDRLEKRRYTPTDVIHDERLAASDQNYGEHVRQVDADTPARFNADPGRLFEASGSAGKLVLFAVRLDTFPAEKSQVFYIGANDTASLTAVRRHMLTAFAQLPIAGEYIHRDAFDIGESHGKDTFLLIDKLGTEYVPKAFALKSRVDAFFEGIGLKGVTDHVLQAVVSILPSHLPKRIKDFRSLYEHHLLVRVSIDSVDETREFLKTYFATHDGDYFECDAEEGRKAFLHRFAVASAAIRYRDTHKSTVEDIVALDIALRRNDDDWFERLPADIEGKLINKLYYGHFFCHVFHQDYIVKKGNDPIAIEHAMWKLLDERGAEYPAEHNVGHLYYAKPALKQFYRNIDPQNIFNPGIGHTSKFYCWVEEAEPRAKTGA